MITDKITNSRFYIKHFPILSEAFNFILGTLCHCGLDPQSHLSRQDCGIPYSNLTGQAPAAMTAFNEGKHIINDNMYAIVEKNSPKPKEEQKLEAHRKYVDLQYIIEGSDVIGWKNLSECADIYKDYENSKDIIFFNEVPDFNIILNKGSFALFFPQDAHAPLCGNKTVFKCVVKIKTELFLKTQLL